VKLDGLPPEVLESHWSLDETIAFLNHGSFGACPIQVLAYQDALRRELEHEPVTFLSREYEQRLDLARTELAAFLGSEPEDLVFVPNATAGANAVLRSLHFESGDELLITDHGYNAVSNAVRFVADRHDARVVVAEVPFPLHDSEVFIQAVLSAAGPRTKLAVLDHVTSPTALVCPVAELVARLAQRGIDTLIDGAHAPGMLPIDLDALGAAYYTGNCHKWLCAPKAVGFLHVRRDRQDRVHPLVISHGSNAIRSDKSRFQLEFQWAGTTDPTPALSVPEAIRFLGSLVSDGWPGLMRRNRALALEARRLICERLEIAEPCPESMIGTMASVPLPPGSEPPSQKRGMDPVHHALMAEFAIDVPVFLWPRPPGRVLRISAQLYNSMAQYRRLADALCKLL
jgi:isopenicillin-N epimerase